MRPIDLLFILILTVGVQACKNGNPDPQSLTDVMNAQAEAWNKGDIETYMTGYWQSDSLVFTGGKNITRGYDPALERYQKAYATKEQMGRLEFSDVNHRFLGIKHAMTTGQWKLYRQQDTLSGRYTLVWKLIDGQWRIIADHSS